MRIFFLFIYFFLFGLASRIFATTDNLLIHLRDKTTVVGPQVSLGDVADVSGDNKVLSEKIRRMDLARAAMAGKVMKITISYVKIALRREGYSVKDFKIDGADASEVLTQSQEFSTEELLPEVRAFVLKELGEVPEHVEVKLDNVEKKIVLPAGELKTSFRPPLSGKFEGSLLLTTEINVNGHLARVLPLRITVEVFHPVVVATKGIEKGDKFTAENVGLVRKRTSEIISGSIGQLRTVIGRTAAISLPLGAILRMTELFDPPVIKHGQIVQAVVKLGNVEITVQARAVEDGKAGDGIRVENTDTHKVLRGKVLDEKTVLVEQDKP